MTEAPVMQSIQNRCFRFTCHRRMPCFNRCCGNLNLVLTPYDILRLKKRLRLSSGQCLDRYTDGQIDKASGLPLVRLRMGGRASRHCPFVQAEGCTVYEDRPGACRLYPLARAALRFFGPGNVSERYFLVKEPHCLGLKAERQWTVDGWLADQGMVEYNVKNDAFAAVFSCRPRQVLRGLTDRHRQMMFTACYDLDGFRDFVFNSTFLERFAVEDDRLMRIETDDAPLLDFAMQWLRFALFGETTLPAADGFAPPRR